MTTQNRIFIRNLERYMSQFDELKKDVAKVCDVSSAAVTKWFNGTNMPTLDKLKVLAEHYGIQVSDLIAENKILVPVYGEVKAGYNAYSNEDIIGWEEITPDISSKGEIFGLRVKGDSMSPTINEDDTVLILHQNTADSGNIVIACISHTTTTIKELQRSPQGVMLIPHNRTYSPVFFSNQEIENGEIIIMGVVVESRRRFL